MPLTLRHRIKTEVIKHTQRNNLVKPALSPEVRRDLMSGYQTDIQQLQTLIKRDLTYWLK